MEVCWNYSGRLVRLQAVCRLEPLAFCKARLATRWKNQLVDAQKGTWKLAVNSADRATLFERHCMADLRLADFEN